MGNNGCCPGGPRPVEKEGIGRIAGNSLDPLVAEKALSGSVEQIPEQISFPAKVDARSSKVVHWVPAGKAVYICDVEGHWDYFCNYVELSEVVRFASPGDHRQARGSSDLELELEPGWHFVFGGDSMDKGPGTLRFLEAMVRLKDKYPDRVHLILGNRDLNKIRWTSELQQSELDRIAEVPPAFWVHSRKQKTVTQFLTELAASQEQVPEAQVTQAMIDKRNTKANKLLYMQKNDMGSDLEFEYRREELAHIENKAVAQITDDDVVQSYEKMLQPGGWMREFLWRGQLGVMIGDALFVHGNIIGNQFPKEYVQGADQQDVAWTIGSIPGQPREDNVKSWLEKLNLWCRSQLEEWEQRPFWGNPPTDRTYESWKDRGGSEIIAYVCSATRYPSVVVARWLTPESMPLKYPPEFVKYLNAQGVRFVIVGHTPHGNSPTVIQNDGVTVVMGDTGLSHMKSDRYFVGDARGEAVCDVIVDGKVHVKGNTEKKEQKFDYFVCPDKDDHCDQYVGRIQKASQARNGTTKPVFVKAKLENSYLVSHVEFLNHDYTILDPETVRKTIGPL